MGFLATLLLAIIFGGLGLLRPRVAFLLIVALTVLFAEMGFGFTTYRGSWVFNASFVGFYGVRLYEVLVFSAYLPFILATKERTGGIEQFQMERTIFPILVVWLLCLIALDYALTNSVNPGSWRLLVAGLMQFHMLMLLFKTSEERMKLVRFVLILLSIKCLYGFAVWAAGMGEISPRGRLPFFWDSKQVEAFSLGAIILTAYLLNYHAIDPKERIIHPVLALLMWVLLLAAVGSSIRRTIWVTNIAGMFIVLMLSRRTTVLHYLTVIMFAATAAGTILLAPGLDGLRDHMGKYVESMNLFDYSQRSRNIENDVHISNVESYSKMLVENPNLMAVGFHGMSTEAYKGLMGEYSDDGYRLGMAHNGPIRTMLTFGIVGLVIYFCMYIVIIRRTLTVYARTPDNLFMKHAGLACGVVLFLDFTATMTFVPPFYTTSKGIFYTFFALFMLGAASQMAAKPHAFVDRGRAAISKQRAGA